MRIVVDTNVLVSALHFNSSTPRRVLEAVLSGEHDLLTGPTLLDELEEVLMAVCGWDDQLAHAARTQMNEIAEVVLPRSRPDVCRDPDDDEVLAIAQWGGAGVIVTGDKDLLAVSEHAGAQILTPRQFLDWQGSQKKSGPAR